MRKDAKKPANPKGGRTPFRRFEELAKRLAAVPKTQIREGETDAKSESSS